jgi:hypothetical protein
MLPNGEDAQAQAASTNTPKHADRAYSLPASVTLKRDQQQCRAVSIVCLLYVGDNQSRAVLLRVFRLKRNRHAVELVHSLRLRSGEISLQLLKLSISEIRERAEFFHLHLTRQKRSNDL